MIDRTGQVYGGLKVLCLRPDLKKGNKQYWDCQCLKCGRIVTVRSDKLNTERVGCRSCANSIRLKSGDKFGMLTALRFDGVRDGASWWLFRCDCGAEIVAKASVVVSGACRSCGCLQREIAAEIGRDFSALSDQVVDGTYLPRLRDNCIPSHNSSGYRGVYFNSARQKWIAQIYFKKKQIVIGAFDDPAEASVAYQAAKERLHGEELERYGQSIDPAAESSDDSNN